MCLQIERSIKIKKQYFLYTYKNFHVPQFLFKACLQVQSAFRCNPTSLNKKKLYLGHFAFLLFFLTATGNLNTLFAAPIPLLNCLGEVCNHEISCTPIPLLLGGLLGEVEVDQLPLHPIPTHPQWEHCLRWSRNCGDYPYESLARPDLLLLHHLLVHQFGRSPRWRLAELQIIVKSDMNCFSQPMSLGNISYSLPLVILYFGGDIGDGLCVEMPLVPCVLWFPLLRLFDKRLHLWSQVLVTVDLLDNFLIPFKLCLALQSNPTKLLIGAMTENGQRGRDGGMKTEEGRTKGGK